MGNLKEIDFYGKNLSPDQTTQISQAFTEKVNESPFDAIILDLSENQLTDESVESLKHILLHPQLLELRFSDNQLTASGTTTLCQVLAQRTTSLQALSLCHNDFSSEQSIQALSQLLSTNADLSYLDLTGCQMPSGGIEVISQAVAQHPSLKTLNLSDIAIGNDVVKIATMLHANTSLESLFLCQCQLQDNASAQLGWVVAHHPRLKTLNIESNDLTAQAATAFLDYLPFNRTLCEYYGPDKDGEIAAICERNQRLPYKMPWSAQYNPEAGLVEQMQGLILNTATTPSSTLLFRAGQEAIRQKKLNERTFGEALANNLLDSTYHEACLTSFQRRNKRKG
ncbi:MAG: hypothetical protein AB7V32_10095 [Candidatus Berkiella sp.]